MKRRGFLGSVIAGLTGVVAGKPALGLEKPDAVPEVGPGPAPVYVAPEPDSESFESVITLLNHDGTPYDSQKTILTKFDDYWTNEKSVAFKTCKEGVWHLRTFEVTVPVFGRLECEMYQELKVSEHVTPWFLSGTLKIYAG